MHYIARMAVAAESHGRLSWASELGALWSVHTRSNRFNPSGKSCIFRSASNTHIVLIKTREVKFMDAERKDIFLS